jgi:hypothetical protein
VLQHVLCYKGIAPITVDEEMSTRELKEGTAAVMNVYSGASEDWVTPPSTYRDGNN